jgi:YegS/Rv2252/BmrU family lipid kinase
VHLTARILRSPTASLDAEALRDAAPERWTLTIEEVAGPQARQAARRAEESVVVAAGGDGTVQQVARGLLDREAPPDLVVLPLGTANDFARHLGLLDRPVAAVLEALDGAAHAVDVLRVGESVSLNQVTLGPPAAITADTPQGLKAVLGGTAYLAHGLVALPGVQPLSARVEVDEHTWSGEALAISVANGCYGGGALPMHPEAHLMDGLLDVVVVPGPLDPSTVVATSADVLGGTTRHLHRWRGRTVRITLPPDTRANLDGEPTTCTSLDVRVEPGRLRIRLPPGVPAPGLPAPLEAT